MTTTSEGNVPSMRKQLRQKEAIERQAIASTRTPAERLAILDAKLGVGKGAKRERAKLEGK